MNRDDGFDLKVSAWLHEDAEHRVPQHLDAVLRRTRTERQRPAWSSLERWLPVQTTLRFAPVPRLFWLAIVAILILAVAAVAASMVGSRPTLPAPFGPARNGAILYGGNDNDIYAFDQTTGTSKALITGSTRDRDPSMSPDGTKFLFLRDTTVSDPVISGLEPMIMVANADGSNVRPLTGALVNYAAALWAHSAEWSHDGSRIVVASEVNGMPALEIFTVDGSAKPVLLDIGGTSPSYVAFRPGDQELTFLGATGNTNGLYATGADGRGFRTILKSVNADYASLSPDGTRLAYQRNLAAPGAYGVINVVDVDTGVVTFPAFEPAVIGQAQADDNPSWSPDGTHLLFQRYINGVYRMAVASAAGGPVILIGPGRPQNGGERVGAQFSPDGSMVMAHYDGDGSTWLLDPTGTLPDNRLASNIAQTATWQRLAP